MEKRIIGVERIEHELLLGFGMLRELDAVALIWEELSQDEWGDWCIEWDEFISVLGFVLEVAYRSDQTMPEQQVRYRDLQLGLRERMHIIEHLDISVPRVSLEM